MILFVVFSSKVMKIVASKSKRVVSELKFARS